MPEINIGERLQSIRLERGLSISTLSAISGVSETHIRNIEKGNSNPTIDVIGALTWALDIELHELFYEEFDLDDVSNSLMKEINKLSRDQRKALRLFIKSMIGE